MEDMEEDDEEYADLFKVVLMGDTAVGKSNLLRRFAKKGFEAASKATIGVEFETQKVSWWEEEEAEEEDRRRRRRWRAAARVQVWDTAGQERFRAVTSAYYRGAQAALLVYDITRLPSFRSLPRWLHELRLHSDDTVTVLVGNKVDLAEGRREVATEEARAYAEAEGMLFLETSALDATNVEAAFESVMREIYKRRRRRIAKEGGSSRKGVGSSKGQRIELNLPIMAAESDGRMSGCCNST